MKMVQLKRFQATYHFFWFFSPSKLRPDQERQTIGLAFLRRDRTNQEMDEFVEKTIKLLEKEREAEILESQQLRVSFSADIFGSFAPSSL
jgi:hypothetical protein